MRANSKMSEELTAALEEVRAEVDDLIDRVAPGARSHPRSDNARRQSCNDAEGAPTGAFRSQFGYVIEAASADSAAQLAGARDFFVSRGLSVNARRVTADPPGVFAEGGGFSYSAIVNSVGRLVVGGTTPCFTPA
jgi:hypothetical protein